MQFEHKKYCTLCGWRCATLRGGDVIVVIGPEKERQSKDRGEEGF